jgi:hypothetical protein
VLLGAAGCYWVLPRSCSSKVACRCVYVGFRVLVGAAAETYEVVVGHIFLSLLNEGGLRMRVLVGVGACCWVLHWNQRRRWKDLQMRVVVGGGECC